MERLTAEGRAQCLQHAGQASDAVFNVSFWHLLAEQLPAGSAAQAACLSAEAREHGLRLRFTTNAGGPLAGMSELQFGVGAAPTQVGACSCLVQWSCSKFLC